DEHALWQSVTRVIAPLKRRRNPLEGKSAIGPSQRANSTASTVALTASAASRSALTARKVAATVSKTKMPPLVPLERRLKQRIGRGAAPIEARLDLHGLTQERAHFVLLQFLRNAQLAGCKTVLVVTGKGGTASAPFGERGV